MISVEEIEVTIWHHRGTEKKDEDIFTSKHAFLALSLPCNHFTSLNSILRASFANTTTVSRVVF